MTHTLTRPSWDCRACGEPWPCADARAALLAEHADAMTTLVGYLGGLMSSAVRDLPDTPVQDFHGRFVGWARHDRDQPVTTPIRTRRPENRGRTQSNAHRSMA